MSINFFVAGVPKPAGSKRPFLNKKTGKINVVDTCKAGKDWRGDVRAVAIEDMKNRRQALYADQPLLLIVDFYMPRPKAHYRANGQLKDSAPSLHTSKPDATKLLRALEDALTGICWRDDSQIAKQEVRKLYGDRTGAKVYIAEASND